MTEEEPALHHTIVVVDIQRYSDASRTERHQGIAHDGLNHALRRAFAEASVDWSICVAQDTGDGALIAVPASVPKSTFVERLPDLLTAELHRHNAASAVEAHIRLRMAVHAGEVRRIGFGGTAGKGLVLASRLVDAPALKAAQRTSTEVLSIIVSDGFYQDVVRQNPGARPDLYREVEVEVKETRTTAWLRSTGSVPPPSAPTAASTATPAVDHAELVNALFEIPSIRDDSSRRVVLSHLPRQIAGAVSSNDRAWIHVFNLVRACLDYENGLRDLLRVLRNLEGDSVAMRQLADKTRTWLGDTAD